MLKEDLCKEIKRLASLGTTPREIEKQLGFRPYTIHIKYHHDLMEGYSIRQAWLEAKEKEKAEQEEKARENARARRLKERRIKKAERIKAYRLRKAMTDVVNQQTYSSRTEKRR